MNKKMELQLEVQKVSIRLAELVEELEAAHKSLGPIFAAIGTLGEEPSEGGAA